MKNSKMKITKDYGTTLNYYSPWEEEVFIFHKFDHKDYLKKQSKQSTSLIFN